MKRKRKRTWQGFDLWDAGWFAICFLTVLGVVLRFAACWIP